jgi:DNA-binding response OmpR family regulator
MRPKKIILYTSASETDMSTMKYMLWTNGYRALTAANEKEALVVLEKDIALVLVDFNMGLTSGNEIVKKLKAIAPLVPMVLLGDVYKMARESHNADAGLSKKLPTIELLERIKVMVARKRGPKPRKKAA